MGSQTLYGKSLIKAGAHGYLSKDAPMSEIQKAMATVLDGKKYISQELLAVLVDELANGEPTNPFLKLSQRETEMTTFLLQGLSVSEISSRVNLQTSTVGTYKSRIFEKLNVTNIIELKELAMLYHF
jgi:DNA-binding NarL/FixJ family response regulator